VTEGTIDQEQRVGGMRTRFGSWLAWSLCALCLLLMAFSLLLILLGWSTPLPRVWSPWRDMAVNALGVAGVPILGGLIASRHPHNPYGWVWLATGLGLALNVLAEPYAAYALVVHPGSLPAPRMGNVVLSLGWISFVTFMPLVLLLFPTGRLPSRRWRYLVWIDLAAGLSLLPLGLLSPESAFGPIENPFAVGGVLGEAIATIVPFLVYVIFATVILSAFSLALRYGRASGVERQQLKWFALAAVLVGATIVGDMLGLDRLLGDVLWNMLDAATTIGLYVAVGVAILRYRLYDIDLIINRTLVYGSLTATLLALYLGGIVVLQRLFVAITGEQSTLAVVASTLLIAALFTPLRRRIQSFIDRRFYRRKYDARKTLGAFSVKLREETDLEALNNELVEVVRETMQPAHVSLWLRSDTAHKGGSKHTLASDGR
jgi:hypothetical protein